MALNSKTLKYVPTTKKEGRFVTMGFGVEIGDLERISSSFINDNFVMEIDVLLELYQEHHTIFLEKIYMLAILIKI